MYTNEPSGMNQQNDLNASNYQNPVGYQQMPNYQQQQGYQQMPNYQQMQQGYQQAPNYQNQQYSQKAPNIFVQFAYSFVPPKYRELAKVKVGVMIAFVVLLVFILTGINFASLAIGYVASGGVSEALDMFPDFMIDDGEFQIEETFLYNEAPMLWYMTDDIREFTYDDAKSYAQQGYTDIILVGRDMFSIYQDGEYQELYFDDLDDFTFSKETIENQIMPFLWIIILLGYVVWFLFRTLWYFLCAAVYMLPAWIVTLIAKKNVSAGNLFRAGVYSKVFMFVFVSIWDMLPIPFAFPGILRVLATTVFLGFAVLFMPEKTRYYR